jgi:hypothetical protein
MQPNESQKFAIARAHVNANGAGKPFVLAFNPGKNEAVLCCPLEKLQKEHPFGMAEEDIFYRAEPGMPVPAEIA